METAFDVIIIGPGPGGYTASIRASQFGYKTVILHQFLQKVRSMINMNEEVLHNVVK